MFTAACCRGGRVWEEYNCQADEDHPRERLHQRGLQAVPARGLQQHHPVPGGHPPSHAQPQHHLQLQRARGGRQDGHGRGLEDGGHRALLRGAPGRHEEAVGGRGRAGVLLPIQ